MDRAEQVETTRFLGREFLVWLWFKTELSGAELRRPNGEAVEMWLDSQLTLQSASDKGERIVLRGVAPSGTQEAKVALQYGKVPTRARVSVTLDTQAFGFTFDADSFGAVAIKLPEVTAKESDEHFYERMHLLQQLDELILEQYREFLTLRVSALWETELVPAIVAWSQGQEPMSPRAYGGLLQRAGARA